MQKALTQSRDFGRNVAFDPNNANFATEMMNSTKDRLFNSVEKVKKDGMGAMTEKRSQTINIDDKIKGLADHSTQNTFTLLNNAQERNVKSSYQSNRVSNMREGKIASNNGIEERA